MHYEWNVCYNQGNLACEIFVALECLIKGEGHFLEFVIDLDEPVNREVDIGVGNPLIVETLFLLLQALKVQQNLAEEFHIHLIRIIRHWYRAEQRLQVRLEVRQIHLQINQHIPFQIPNQIKPVSLSEHML